MADEGGFLLEPKRRLACGVPLPWRWPWWLILAAIGLLLAVGGLALVLAVGYSQAPATEALPTMTLVPTFTPRPGATAAPPLVSLAVQPWTDDSGPLGLVEVTLSLPAGARLSHEPPPGFRYWRGDLLATRQGLGWSGAESGQVRWYLLREPGAALPASLAVTVNRQTLTVPLLPAAPATTTAPWE
jgi:hypothetical protein